MRLCRSSQLDTFRLTDDDRATLQHWRRQTTITQALQRRAAVLLALDAHAQPVPAIAQDAQVTRDCLRKWARCYARDGLDGLRTPYVTMRQGGAGG